jgi:hypothetical protein
MIDRLQVSHVPFDTALIDVHRKIAAPEHRTATGREMTNYYGCHRADIPS